MAIRITTPPAALPVSLGEAQAYLRIDTTGLSKDLTPVTTLPPGERAPGTYPGAAVEVLGERVVPTVSLGMLDTGASVALQVEESENAEAWAPVGSPVTAGEADSYQSMELAYDGPAQWIRVVATVTGGSVELSASVVKDASTSPEDPQIRDLIALATELAELHTGRAFVARTVEIALDEFPAGARPLAIPVAPLMAVEAIRYVTPGGTERELDASSYLVDTTSAPGRVALRSGSWPVELQPINGGRIVASVGYGEPSQVPMAIRMAILLAVQAFHKTRGKGEIPEGLPEASIRMLDPFRLYVI
jgi:uncharacterized phiE125 gp8 family phage protein